MANQATIKTINDEHKLFNDERTFDKVILIFKCKLRPQEKRVYRARNVRNINSRVI